MGKAVVWFLIAILGTLVFLPSLDFPHVAHVYGSRFIDVEFLGEYVQIWWRKLFRRITGQYGPAELATPVEKEAETYTLPKHRVVGQPTDIYELATHLKANTHTYSRDILRYIEENKLPNKPAQIDLMIVPENIYLTFVWDGSALRIHDGWTGDTQAKIWIEATATSQLLLDLYANKNDPLIMRNLLLEAEGNGELTYTVKRLNPELSEILIFIQIVSGIIGIIGWIMLLLERRRRALAS